MSSLIEQILSIENEANKILEKAQAEAKALEKEVSRNIYRIQQETTEKVDAKIAEFRVQTEARHAEDVAREQQTGQKSLEILEKIPANVLTKQVENVVAKFLEI